MGPRFLWIAVLMVSVAGTAVPVRAQSLAEIARQEAERRKAIKDGGKVITNADLPRPPAPAAGPAKPEPSTDAKAASPAPAPDAKAEPQAKTEPAKADTPKEPVKDQAYWAGRQKLLTEQLERDQITADAMQSRINALTTDFVNRDDPAQRAVIFNDRQRALAELDRLKKAIADGKKALADFEEEARRAGVPPGWLR
jgi:hypothetical protein